jgi:hypothetical protein
MHFAGTPLGQINSSPLKILKRGDRRRMPPYPIWVVASLGEFVMIFLVGI